MTIFQKQRLGKYILFDKLAEGSTSEFYRATITGIQGFEKLIAIKKILPHLADEEELAGIFIDEAKLAALLHHQNIVQIYDFGSLGETCYIAMEYLFGKDCRMIDSKAQEKNLPMELPLALLILTRICAGLDYAHNLKDFQGKPLNIVHRDISPRNVFITYEGDVKIVDFGISREAVRPEIAETGMIKDKIAYMSPEQASGGVIDCRSDIFSCGIVLYEMVTGKRMYSGDTLQILPLVRKAQFEKPEEIRRDLPEKVVDILSRSLAKKPADRYQSCGAMLADLEECFQHLDAHPTSRMLAKYMKTLFAEEIILEERQTREIVALMKEQTGAGCPPHPAAGKTAVAGKRHLLDSLQEAGIEADSSDEQSSIDSRKTLYTGIAVAITVTIALVTTFRGNNNEQYPPAAIEPQAITAGVEQSGPALSGGREGLLLKTSSPELYQQAMDALLARHFDEAVKIFENLQQLDPGMRGKTAVPYAEALTGQAEKTARTDPQEATALLEKATAINPAGEKAHFQLGMLYLKQKNYPRAITNYEHVIRLNPKFPDTYFNLGFIYAQGKNYAKAEEMYARTVQFAPDYLDEAFFNLAVIQNEQGKKADAVANLEKAVAFNPKNTSAGNYLKKMKEAAGADQ